MHVSSPAVRAVAWSGLALVYIATARFGLTLDPVGGFATLVWPPTGIALAALVRIGQWQWSAVMVGAFVANVWTGAPWPVAAGIAVGNTLEALFGAQLLRRLPGYAGPVGRSRDAFALLAVALLSSSISASFGVLSLASGGVVAWTRTPEVWQAWWLGDVLGDLVVAPVLLNSFTARKLAPSSARVVEAGALVTFAVASAVFSFSGDSTSSLQRPHMIFPALVWAAIRFGPSFASCTVLLVSIIAIAFAAHGTGPYGAATLHENLTALQGFMGTAALTSIFLAAASRERATALRLLGDEHAALQATTHKLQEALHARDDFLSIASHELRTPLAALTMQISSLQRMLRTSSATEQPSQELQKAERAAGQVERLTRLVDSLLDISRISAGRLQLQRETFDLSSLLRHVASQLQEQASRAGCTVSVTAPESISGSWDRFRIEQVITNLLTNAFKYGAGQPVAMSLEASDSTAVLRVSDHGIGIPPDAVNRIFERFERVAQAHQRKSLGFGLYIARQVVDAHAGSIRVESSSDTGSTFVVELPRSAPEPAPA